jgi:hypothetical protein
MGGNSGKRRGLKAIGVRQGRRGGGEGLRARTEALKKRPWGSGRPEARGEAEPLQLRGSWAEGREAAPSFQGI